MEYIMEKLGGGIFALVEEGLLAEPKGKKHKGPAEVEGPGEGAAGGAAEGSGGGGGGLSVFGKSWSRATDFGLVEKALGPEKCLRILGNAIPCLLTPCAADLHKQGEWEKLEGTWRSRGGRERAGGREQGW